jgi:hypothetical protein
MGYGAHMLVVNNDTQPHTIEVTNVDNMDGDGSTPDFWNGKTIQPFSSSPQTGFVYLESSGWSESSFDLIIDGNVTIPFREDGTYFLEEGVQLPPWIAVGIDNNESKTPDNRNQAVITVCFLNQNTTGWMGQLNAHTNGKFFDQTFSQVCLPGSHDTGMSVITRSTATSTSGNTQTQTLNMLQQLEAGARYFDVRPAFWDKETWDNDGMLYAGHFGIVVSSIQGSLGQDIISLLEQVSSFATANKNEIVILKFSHYDSQDGTSFGTDQMNGDPNLPDSGLLPNIKQYLGDLMYTHLDAKVNIGALKLSDIASTGKNVICIFDSYSGGNLQDTSNGIFALGSLYYESDGTTVKGVQDEFTPNYYLFDNYSNTDLYKTLLWSGYQTDGIIDWDTEPGQITPYWENWQPKFGNAGNIFNFSYTLTLIGRDNINPLSPTIIENALKINPFLLGNIANNYFLFSMQSIPNILYVDAVGLIPQVEGNRRRDLQIAQNMISPVNEAIYTNMLYLSNL